MRILGSAMWLAAAGGVAFECSDGSLPCGGDEETAEAGAADPDAGLRTTPVLPGAAEEDRAADPDAWALVPGVPRGDLESLGDGTGDVPWLGALDRVYRRNIDVWTPVALPAEGYPYAIWAADPEDVWLAGRDGHAWRWTAGRWRETEVVDGKALQAVWGTAPDDVWTVGDEGTVARFDGIEWRAVPVPTERTLRAVHGSGPNDVWAVGDAGTVLRWDGSSWTAFESGTTEGLRGVWSAAPDDAWAVGAEGTILHWDGGCWSPVESPTDAGLAAVEGRAADDVWAVGAEGTVLHWDGTSWSEEPNPCTPLRSLFDLSVGDDGSVWAVGSCRLLRRAAGR